MNIQLQRWYQAPLILPLVSSEMIQAPLPKMCKFLLSLTISTQPVYFFETMKTLALHTYPIKWTTYMELMVRASQSSCKQVETILIRRFTLLPINGPFWLQASTECFQTRVICSIRNKSGTEEFTFTTQVKREVALIPLSKLSSKTLFCRKRLAAPANVSKEAHWIYKTIFINTSMASGMFTAAMPPYIWVYTLKKICTCRLSLKIAFMHYTRFEWSNTHHPSFIITSSLFSY